MTNNAFAAIAPLPPTFAGASAHHRVHIQYAIAFVASRQTEAHWRAMRGCTAAGHGLPKRSSPEAVLYRSVATYPGLLCRSGPLPQRSSAEAPDGGNTLPPDGSWTETKRWKFVGVCICNLPRRSGTAARDGNKKRDYVASSPLQRNH